MRPATAIVFKEWIKLRRYVWIPPVLVLMAVFQALLSFNGFRLQHGAVEQYSAFIDKEPLLYALLRPALFLGGGCLALAQFLPDCAGRRLRLIFHLPLDSGFCLRLMLGVGYLCCALTFCLAVLALALGLARFGFPREIILPMLASLAPWGGGMLVAYSATAAFLAEPVFWRKLAYAAAGYLCLEMIAPEAKYGAGGDLALRAAICLLWIPVVEAAALRVKEGER